MKSILGIDWWCGLRFSANKQWYIEKANSIFVVDWFIISFIINIINNKFHIAKVLFHSKYFKNNNNNKILSALDSIRSMFDFRAAEKFFLKINKIIMWDNLFFCSENEIIPVAGIDADFDRCVQVH